MCVHKVYICDYSTPPPKKNPGVSEDTKAGCIAHSVSGSLKQKNQTMEMQAVIMQLGFMVH